MIEMADRITGLFSEKNTNLEVTTCNQVFMKYAGVRSEDKILGHTDLDFPWADYADTYRAHEVDALNGNNYSAILPSKDFNGEDLFFLNTKIQKNDSKGSVIGVICRSIEIINPRMTELIKLIEIKSPIKSKRYCTNKEIGTVKLSKQQKEVLFYLLKGKRTKTIAAIMNLSPRTVEHYIDHIRTKFNCDSKAELISFAISQRFLEFIPSDNMMSLLKKIKS